MNLYLGGSISSCEQMYLKEYGCNFLLQTFYDLKNKQEKYIREILSIPKKDFMLDSGAFTFMNTGKKGVDWKEYISKYIEFINKYKIKYYIELDLYSILGVDSTEKIRDFLYENTGIFPIPVYHGTMPLSYYRDLCKKYPYVAISATGTIESSKWTRNKKILNKVINIGKSYNTKLHGLGYTKLDFLNNQDLSFDSVDSSSWLSGARYGCHYYIKHSNIFMASENTNLGYKKRSHSEWAEINLKAWIYMQKKLYEGEKK